MPFYFSSFDTRFDKRWKIKEPFQWKNNFKDTVIRNFTIRKVVITIYLQDSCIVRPIVTSANIMYAFLPQQFQRWYLPNVNCLLKLLIRMSQNLWYFKEVSKHSRKDLCDFRKCLKLKAYWSEAWFRCARAAFLHAGARDEGNAPGVWDSARSGGRPCSLQ